MSKGWIGPYRTDKWLYYTAWKWGVPIDDRVSDKTKQKAKPKKIRYEYTKNTVKKVEE